jgi:PAS domain-containing protein
MAPELSLIQLTRQMAEALAVPVFIVDRAGTLLYYNPPAEGILGKSFAETGQMQASVWSRLFVPTDGEGTPLLPESLPLMATLNGERPATGRIWIRGLDNTARHIEISSFPLTTTAGVFLGAVAMFWEAE